MQKFLSTYVYFLPVDLFLLTFSVYHFIILAEIVHSLNLTVSFCPISQEFCCLKCTNTSLNLQNSFSSIQYKRIHSYVILTQLDLSFLYLSPGKLILSPVSVV